MCCPWGTQREEQQQVARGYVAVPQLDDKEPEMPPLRLGGTDSGAVIIDCCSLIRLDVLGAEAPDMGRHWAVVDDRCRITVRAVTQPDVDGAWAQINWAGELASNAHRDVELPRTNRLGGRQVAASLRENRRMVLIEVVDLTTLTAPQLILLNDRPLHWKAYESAVPGRLAATVAPAEDWVRSKLQWEGAAPAGPGLADVDLTWPALQAADSTPVERPITVTLGTICPKTLVTAVRVCRWPTLALARVHFDGYSACNDGVAEIGVPFDCCWLPGRADPLANQAAGISQSPVVYAAGLRILLDAQFDVTIAPSEIETVRIRGSAMHAGVNLVWEQDAIVNPGDATVVFPSIAANAALPAAVHAGRLQIDWTMSTPGHPVPHLVIGNSDNPFYVLLRPPIGGELLYLTLLDLGCTGGHGTIDEASFVPAAFAPLAASTGDGNGIQRKGDGVRLSYYLHGVDTQANDSVWVAHDILGSPLATARCGGWKDMLQKMYRMHGITTYGLACVRESPAGPTDYDLRFLAGHNACNGVAGNPTAWPYTHLGRSINSSPDVPGQGKSYPQWEFGDHVVLWHGDNIYDPSYGVGPVAAAWNGVYVDALAYETLAIGGFGDAHGRSYSRYSRDGTHQSFAEKIGSQCLIAYTCIGGETRGQIVAYFAQRIYPRHSVVGARGALGQALVAAGYGLGPYVPGDVVAMEQPRTGIVLKWTFS